MALKEKTIVEQRLSAMELLKAGESVARIAERYEVSRQTVYDWKKRYQTEGAAGLKDHSRRPHRSPSRTEESLERRLIEERQQWGFGSKKILRRLQEDYPEVEWPPRSTVDAIFKRAGLVQSQRTPRRPFAPIDALRPEVPTVPGEVMTVDFKGQFRLRNGQYCYPLTMADPVSRYLLACDAFAAISHEQTWATFTRVFREHGMPKRLHSDNGIPFGTSGHGRFSTISARLMKYGIQPVYSRAGHPEDNGVHERMHRTLKQHTAISPEKTLEEQQVRFDQFRTMFNEERPHEALGLDRPARRHRPSLVPFPAVEPVLVYPPHFETLLVDSQGRVKWRSDRFPLSMAFAGELVAFEPLDSFLWRVHYAGFSIGQFDERVLSFR
jgi:putative transposase